MGSDGGLIEDLEVATFWDLFWRRKNPNLVVENCGRWAVGGLGEKIGGWWFGGGNEKNSSSRFEERGNCGEHERR